MVTIFISLFVFNFCKSKYFQSLQIYNILFLVIAFVLLNLFIFDGKMGGTSDATMTLRDINTTYLFKTIDGKF